MEKMTNSERLEYLREKRKWLQEKGLDLRPNRLKEMINLMEQASDKTETDESQT